MLYVYQLMYISQNSAHTLWVEMENVKRCGLYESNELPVFCPCCQVGGGGGGGGGVDVAIWRGKQNEARNQHIHIKY